MIEVNTKVLNSLKDNMTIFRSRGFDTLIGKGTSIRGDIAISANSTTVIDGDAALSYITGVVPPEKVATKTTLMVNGTVVRFEKPLEINVHNVIITGQVTCDTITVEGTLAIKTGAVLKAKKILYRELIIETGAVVHGQMFHLDHTSEGEQT
ncbi:hypothetical protein [Acinetobacter sp.]|uniref:hypothetical protein n=1 Tax=Acinetobacter sp. TaxID=472 RepID=UPI00388D8181